MKTRNASGELISMVLRCMKERYCNGKEVTPMDVAGELSSSYGFKAGTPEVKNALRSKRLADIITSRNERGQYYFKLR